MSLCRYLLMVILYLLCGCSHIPQQAPELSSELGKIISAIEKSNLTLLERYFDQKRSEVDRFIEEEWIPEFSKQFFSNSTIAKIWDTIVSKNDKEERLTFLLKTGPRLQKRIDEKRRELIRPLDDLERAIRANIRGEYSRAKAINNSITSFLISAAEVTESQNRFLGMFGVTDDKITKLIDHTDDAVTDLIGKIDSSQDKISRSQEFLRKVKSIQESI